MKLVVVANLQPYTPQPQRMGCRLRGSRKQPPTVGVVMGDRPSTIQVDIRKLPHSAPSWILSSAENLASFSLQDGARIGIGTIIIEQASQPASHPDSQQPTLILCGVPPPYVFEFCAVSPPQFEHLNTFSCVVSPPDSE